VEEGSAAMGLDRLDTRRTDAGVEYSPSSQESWVTTKLDFLVNWGRANSL
jgi:NADH:ubiquinone oxidoreductase subunit B-like Fe-S oxidoreductase